MSTRDRTARVAGVDGCRAGWVVAVVAAPSKAAHEPCHRLPVEGLYTSGDFADVLLRTSGCALVCVDIPIGLRRDAQPRACDVAARQLLGSRASSVFTPPVRSCLSASSYAEASEIQYRHTGKKLNKQSFFILDKVRQVDNAITPALQERVREIHPEVSFSVLNDGRPARHNKKRLAGRRERIALLSGIFPDAPEIIQAHRRSGRVEVDDILDALVAAWTAARAHLAGTRTLPEHTECDDRGLRMEILYPSLPAQLSKRSR